MIEKVIGSLVILLLIYVSIAIYRHHAKEFFTGIKQYQPVPLGALIVILLLVFSKVLDGIARKLARVGVELNSQLSSHLMVLEEVLELGMPIILILTFHGYFKQLRNV